MTPNAWLRSGAKFPRKNKYASGDDFDGRDILLARLGEHTTGKVCVYIRRLANIDLKLLEKLVAWSVADEESLSAAQ